MAGALAAAAAAAAASSRRMAQGPLGVWVGGGGGVRVYMVRVLEFRVYGFGV